MKRILYLITGLTLAICLSGCATVLTYTSPLKSKIVTRKTTKTLSKPCYYDCYVKSEGVYLTKKLYCTETAQVYRIAKKRSEIALPLLFAELPLYGFGWLDYSGAMAVSELSKVEYLLGEFETGKPKLCSESKPASNEAVVIKNKQQNICYAGHTNAKGALNLKKVLGDSHNKQPLIISLKSQPSVSFNVIYGEK